MITLSELEARSADKNRPLGPFFVIRKEELDALISDLRAAREGLVLIRDENPDVCAPELRAEVTLAAMKVGP